MGKIDTITKDYMKNNSVFSDAFNYFLYGGRQVIRPENLQVLDIKAARVIKACANTEIEIDEKAEVVDVCKAEREMKEKARLETLYDAVRNVMESFEVSVEEAMKALKIREEDQAVLMKLI